jgi:uncharacterized membrane-anchored protein
MSLSLTPTVEGRRRPIGEALSFGAMRRDNVPAAGLQYWIALGAASVLGGNIGSLVASVTGSSIELPLVAAAGFASILLLERNAKRPNVAWYWSAFVLVQAAAASLADFTGRQFGTVVALATSAGLLGATLLPDAARDRSRRGEASADALPPVDGRYWLGMLTAGALGTALGDFTSAMSGLGLSGASLLLSGLAALLIMARRTVGRASILSYWLVVVAIRAAGASVGGFSAQQMGLASSAAVAALVLACVLFYRPKPHRRLAGAAGASR